MDKGIMFHDIVPLFFEYSIKIKIVIFFSFLI
jgi:hypothetical protein